MADSHTKNKNNKPGTEGVLYEYYLAAYFALVLNQNANVKDFVLQPNNENGFGKFDDITIRVTLQTNDEHYFAIQTKHRRNKTRLKAATLENNDDHFGLESYCRSYKKSVNKEYKKGNCSFILFTNLQFDNENAKEVRRFTWDKSNKNLLKEKFLLDDFTNASQSIHKFVTNKKSANVNTNSTNTHKPKIDLLNDMKVFLQKTNLENASHIVEKLKTFLENKKSSEKRNQSGEKLAKKYLKEFWTLNCLNTELLNTFLKHICYKKQKQKTSSCSEDDFKLFFKNFSLWTNQKPFQDIKKLILDRLNGNQTVTLGYVELFQKWHQHYLCFTNDRIDKETLNIYLLDLYLSSSILTYNYIMDLSKSKDLFEAAMKNFNLTIVNVRNRNFFKRDTSLEKKSIKKAFFGRITKQQINYYKDKFKIEITPNLNENNKKGLLRLAKEFKIVEKTTIELTIEQELKILYYLFRIPIIVNYDEYSKQVIKEALKSYLIKEGKIIIILQGNDIHDDNFEIPVFRNLKDLKNANSTLFEEIVNECTISLRGGQFSLKKLIDNDDEIAELVTAKDVYEMLNKGVKTTTAPVSKSSISRNLLTIFDRKNHTDSVIIDNTLDSQLEEDRRQFSAKKIGQTCHVHLIRRINNGNYVVVETTMDSLKLKTIEFGQGSVQDDFFAESVQNVLYCQPGAGKSLIIKHLMNQCPLKYWPIEIDVFKLKKNKNEIKEKLDNIFNIKNSNYLDQKIKNLYLTKKKVAIFVDGLEEIDCLRDILDYVQRRFPSCPIWLSSRQLPHKNLEQQLNTFTMMDLEKLNENQQKEFINRRLLRYSNEQERDQFFKKVQTVFDDHRQILGIPLLLMTITQEDVLSDIRNSNNLNLSHLYGVYFKELYKTYLKKRGETFTRDLLENKFMDLLENYQILALESSLRENNIFNELESSSLKRIQRQKDAIKNRYDPLGIIVKFNDENKAVFEHHTFAKFLLFQYLTGNIKRVQRLREEDFCPNVDFKTILNETRFEPHKYTE